MTARQTFIIDAKLKEPQGKNLDDSINLYEREESGWVY